MESLLVAVRLLRYCHSFNFLVVKNLDFCPYTVRNVTCRPNTAPFQLLDLLWSDPKAAQGCEPNTFRGGGTYFGPDISADILDKHNFKMLIRSHECKPDGYDVAHDGRVCK